MANDEHVAWFKQGVAVWNSIYFGNRRDLSGANLRKADLSGAEGADLRQPELLGSKRYVDS
jgi:uncharacterized protein YjbI with pentapeptide repeats